MKNLAATIDIFLKENKAKEFNSEDEYISKSMEDAFDGVVKYIYILICI